MSPETEQVPPGSVVAGRRVRFPGGAERPFVVFVNGIEQAEGADYAVHGLEIEFRRPLLKEQVSRIRWMVMLLGLFGSYGRHDTVDLHFRHGGSMKVVTAAEIQPD